MTAPSGNPVPTMAAPVACPGCGVGMMVTRLSCARCGTEVTGAFAHPAVPFAADPAVSAPGQGARDGRLLDQPGAAGINSGSDSMSRTRLVQLVEPHASLLELFLRVRGNVKDVERELGLSYPTVRARLEEAFQAAQPLLSPARDRPMAAPPARSDVPSASSVAAPPDLEVPELTEPAERHMPHEVRAAVLSALERGEITATEASAHLRARIT